MIPMQRLLNYMRLGVDAEDPQRAMEAISIGVVFRGTNLLILVFAILIASVGLNVNSTAVVIGAMLISPLMGPIMGVGAGLGVMDLWLVRRSLKNIAFAVGVSVVTSALYFLISPLSEAHSEILARTTPTIWDVLIALSGGFAGIIAVASKEKVRGNVVPGVAIATALMPPLCTAGYGLAHLNWSYFAGAMYLFVINSVFISIAALFTVRWLGYPMRMLQDAKLSKNIKRFTTVIVLVTVVPSIYLAYNLVRQNAFTNKAEEFIAYESAVPRNFLMERHIDPKGKSISLTYLGTGISPETQEEMKKRLSIYGIPDADLQIRTGLSLQELDQEQREKDEGMQRKLDDQRALLNRLGMLTDSISQVRSHRDQIMEEAKASYPGLRWLAVADLPAKDSTDKKLSKVVSAHFKLYPDTSETARLENWLKVKLKGLQYEVAITADSIPGKAIGRTIPSKRK